MGWEYLDAAFVVLSDVAHGEFPKAWSAVISANPVALCGGLFIAVVAYCFFGGLITNTHSYVDQLWSILPAAYALVFWYFGGVNSRVQVMTAIVTAWAIRLTFNFWRKGVWGNRSLCWDAAVFVFGRKLAACCAVVQEATTVLKTTAGKYCALVTSRAVSRL